MGIGHWALGIGEDEGDGKAGQQGAGWKEVIFHSPPCPMPHALFQFMTVEKITVGS